MWELLARIGSILRADIENKINLRIVTDLKDVFYGLKTADELIEMLHEKRYLPEMNYEGWYVGIPVPNEETAFAVQSVNVLYTALSNGNTELASDVADVIQALPEKRFLSDKVSVDAFNSIYIGTVNNKWKEKILLDLMVIRK